MKIRLAAVLAAVAVMVAVLAAPAAAQSINVSPSVNALNDNNTTVQCVADPLTGALSTDDQCADDGGSNEEGGGLFPDPLPFP